MMFSDDDLDVHSEIVRIAENLDDAANGCIAIFRKLENLDVHDHSVQVFNRSDFSRAPTPTRSTEDRCARHFHAFRNLDPLLNPVV